MLNIIKSSGRKEPETEEYDPTQSYMHMLAVNIIHVNS